MSKPDECNVCYITYDESERRPRTLPCGHTFCSPCISSLMVSGSVFCPDCRTCHPATSIDQFPVVYALEAMMKLMKAQLTQDTEAACETRSGEAAKREMSVQTEGNASQTRPSGMSKKLQSMLEEQKSSVNALVTDCQITRTDLDEFQIQLADWRGEHLKFQEKLQTLIGNNAAAVVLIEQEDARVLALKQEGEEGERQLRTSLGYLQDVNTAHEAVTAIDLADRCSVEVEDWRQKCLEQFPDVNTLTTSWQVREVTRMALDILAEENGATCTPDFLPDPTSTIREKARQMTELLRRVTVEELCALSKPVKRLVKAGQVAAIQDHQGCLRTSKITLVNSRLHLHCLQNKPPPPSACTVPMSEVMGGSSTLVFLDLAWGGSTRGRVYIQLISEEPASKQFVLLCTGERGPSYCKTNFLGVKLGEPREFVWAGDYDKKGGAALLPLNGGKQHKSYRAGTVWRAFPGDSSRGAQFCIATKDCDHTDLWLDVFGLVKKGLEVVREAVSQKHITQVTIVDCGLVLVDH